MSAEATRRSTEAGRGRTPLPASAVGARRRRAALILAVGAMVATLLAGCAPANADPAASASVTADAPRAVTAAEADLLAGVGFQLGRRDIVAVAATIVDSGGALALNGWLAPTTHRAYAMITTPQGAGFLSLWTTTEVAAQDTTAVTAPTPIPAAGWESTHLDPSASTLAAGQALLLSLATDRPDNAQLVMQGGAQRLREDTVGDVAVTVFSGPLSTGATSSNLRYWVAADGMLARLEMRLDGVNWSTADFAPETRDIFAGLGG